VDAGEYDALVLACACALSAWIAIRPLAAVRDLHDAPPVEAAGVFPQSIWRHSHIRLTEEEFARARELIEAAA
jgi:triacylglycerol esterase/lipase EstA (alpha/beta hydrolase family)